MGVVIKTYQNITKAESNEEYDFMAFVILNRWEDRITTLENRGYYNGEVHFSISYGCGTHNAFRGKLAKLIGETRDWMEIEDKTIPFAYLFDFADNEGCFDYKIARILYRDFKKYEVEANLSEDTFFKEHYNNWLHLLKVAKNKGVVVYS